MLLMGSSFSRVVEDEPFWLSAGVAVNRAPFQEAANTHEPQLCSGVSEN